VQWQPLTIALGAAVPEEVDAAGCGQAWRAAVAAAEQAAGRIGEVFPEQARYCVTLGHRLRYQLRLNAREAMHLIELRTSPQGHPSYRRVCLEMHRQIREVAGHPLVAAAMRFVGSDDVHLGRYAAEAARGTGAD
jgi:thymidylate synthase ThyX